jgi:glyceraldehyde-3-phosphate dehydrogenase (NADP+)
VPAKKVEPLPSGGYVWPDEVPGEIKMRNSRSMFLGGEWASREARIEVRCPFDNTLVGRVASATAKEFTTAIDRAHRAFAITRRLASYEREAACKFVAEALEKRSEEFARMMSRELGKAIKESRLEVARAVGVFRLSAEEAKRIGGEIIDLDWNRGSEERFGLVRRFPLGVIGAITPFNFPLNLVAHKVGPAMASGNTIVLKPASKTPIIALMLAEILEDCGYPKGAISILPGSAESARPLLDDPRVKLITFTGSDTVGWWIKAHCGKKPVVLELGGNAGVVIADDADLDFATTRLLFGAFGVAGQSCISVQRIFVQEKVYSKFLSMFKRKVARLKLGNPLDPKTDIGTMVDKAAVQNSVTMIKAATQEGARVVVGGKARGLLMQPTILTGVKRSSPLCAREAFAPVAVVEKYRRFTDAVAAVNDSEYGLQAGVFTNRMKDVFYAFREIDCGGVVINDVPTYRADQQPYGGMKDSGLGREGVRYAIEDMTAVKILSVNPR